METISNQNSVVSIENLETLHANNANNNNNVNCKVYLIEGVGWIGSILVLIPYVVPFSKTIDFVLNTMGASGLFVVCVTSNQYQSIVINAAWILGGIYKYFYS
jgi:hypothetical protein